MIDWWRLSDWAEWLTNDRVRVEGELDDAMRAQVHYKSPAPQSQLHLCEPLPAQRNILTRIMQFYNFRCYDNYIYDYCNDYYDLNLDSHLNSHWLGITIRN